MRPVIGPSALVAIARRHPAGVVLVGLFAFAVVFALVEVVPHARNPFLATGVTALLILIWVFYREGERVLGSRRLLAIVFLLGVGMGIARALTLEADAEITHVYRSLFDALARGDNPYEDPVIYHRAGTAVRYGTFNHPPLEILPYYLVYELVGSWSRGVLVATLVSLQLLVCAVLKWTFPWVPTTRLAAFLPWFVFFEFTTNVATTFLMVALVVKAMESLSAAQARWLRPTLSVLFGLSLLTKFLAIPIFAAYFWNQFAASNPRRSAAVALESGLALVVALLGMAPFGVGNVLESTIGFNLHLDARAQLTTYYPNVLSAAFYWLGAPELYGVAAVVILMASILAAPRFSPYAAILIACYTFMFVVPTPEGQFVPVILYLALAGVLRRVSQGQEFPASPARAA